MTAEIGLVLLILGVAIVLFASEKIRVDVVSMMVLLALLLTGLLTPDEAFSGFSNPAVITVWAIYIVSASLTRTGIADFIGRYLARVAGMEEWRLVLVLMVAVGVMSAFMNNIGATAVLLPVAIQLGRRANVPVSKLLIPLAFGSLLGGVTTLIGTPPNLLVSTALLDMGMEPFALFDFTPMGLIIMTVSIAYMTLIGRHLLPSYQQATHAPDLTDLESEYRLRDFLTELRVESHSPLIGKTIAESRLGEHYDMTVMGVLHNDEVRLGILPDTHIQAGDILLAKGESNTILSVLDKIGASIVSGQVLTINDLRSVESTVAEVVVSQLATMIGKTLKDVNFRARYDLNVLAIWREEAPIRGRLGDVPLRMGDTLLVHGPRDRIERLRDDNSFLLLRPAQDLLRLNKAAINLVIFVSMITMVGFGWLHISVAAVLGAVLSVVTGCLSMDEAYTSIEWKSVYLIAGMLPMGIAMEKTGTATFLSEQILAAVGGMGPTAVLIGLFILTTIITAFMSNAAAAVLVAPIAINTALAIGVDPRAFAMGVGIAASNAFLFPIGHQSCVLVYGPGGYRFFDYTKVGLPLTLLIWLLMIIFLPIFWPL
ncbi:MAG: SLC13 family permease [Ardenticatenaceae bacterium]|nr:SLC13 family permease [Ardenticatenaceae bacterium]